MSLQTSSQIDEVCLFILKDTKSLQLNDENDLGAIVTPKTGLHPHPLHFVVSPPPIYCSRRQCSRFITEILPKISFSAF